MINFEIKQTPDSERRRRVQRLASHAHRSIAIGKVEVERAQQLERWGILGFDALHLACAEHGGADVFLTTDDKLLGRAGAHAHQLRVRVENPLIWLREVS
jgi:predicted nucleic acid-binding protein